MRRRSRRQHRRHSPKRSGCGSLMIHGHDCAHSSGDRALLLPTSAFFHCSRQSRSCAAAAMTKPATMSSWAPQVAGPRWLACASMESLRWKQARGFEPCMGCTRETQRARWLTAGFSHERRHCQSAAPCAPYFGCSCPPRGGALGSFPPPPLHEAPVLSRLAVSCAQVLSHCIALSLQFEWCSIVGHWRRGFHQIKICCRSL